MAKRKKNKVFSRRARTGIAAAPTKSFHWFADYIRMEVDKKEIVQTIKGHFKANSTKAEYKIIQNAPEWAFSTKTYLAAMIAWKALGYDYAAGGNEAANYKRAKEEFIKLGNKRIEEKKNEAKDTKPKKTIQEIVTERTEQFIGEIEEVLDRYHEKGHEESMNYSLYKELSLRVAPNNMAKAVFDYYSPIRDEIKELVNDKPEDLVEAYSFMNLGQRKKYLEFLEYIVSDVEKYMASKKAVRKVRIAKPKSALKQIAKIQYLKESMEDKLTSINPAAIVGAQRLYTYNIKYKRLTELVSNGKGFEISGSTIKNIDNDLSRSIALRKPVDILPMVLKKTPPQIRAVWNELTTKTASANGRINKDTILLRAMDR